MYATCRRIRSSPVQGTQDRGMVAPVAVVDSPRVHLALSSRDVPLSEDEPFQATRSFGTDVCVFSCAVFNHVTFCAYKPYLRIYTKVSLLGI